MIVFVGSVFSPWYHWAGRRRPDDHVAVNVALYRPRGRVWAMTERGAASLARQGDRIAIGGSRMWRDGAGGLELDLDETALPWPGQRLWPGRLRARLSLRPVAASADAPPVFALDPAGRHHWSPVLPRARLAIACDAFPGGGFEGDAYHDANWGARPLEADFRGWDWARGSSGDGGARIVYDAVLVDGAVRRIGLALAPDGSSRPFEPPPRQPLPRGFWGVSGGIACDGDTQPRRLARLEDTPFYTRSLVATRLAGTDLAMMQESLDCRRLAHPLVRLMLPFRMPRRARPAASPAARD